MTQNYLAEQQALLGQPGVVKPEQQMFTQGFEFFEAVAIGAQPGLLLPVIPAPMIESMKGKIIYGIRVKSRWALGGADALLAHQPQADVIAQTMLLTINLGGVSFVQAMPVGLFDREPDEEAWWLPIQKRVPGEGMAIVLAPSVGVLPVANVAASLYNFELVFYIEG